MNHPSADETDIEYPHPSSSLPPSLPSIPAKQRASHPQLVTRIYYPDTLYPDSYSFFADRSESTAAKQRSPPPTMDINNQQPPSITDTTAPSTLPSAVYKQTTTDIEIIDRHNKYAVSTLPKPHRTRASAMVLPVIQTFARGMCAGRQQRVEVCISMAASAHPCH